MNRIIFAKTVHDDISIIARGFQWVNAMGYGYWIIKNQILKELD